MTRLQIDKALSGQLQKNINFITYRNDYFILQTYMYQAALSSIVANDNGRDFAVGDIHGCFSALQRALDHIGFDPQVDRLFSVGDLVDRGPESLEVTHWLDLPWFHAICGNHEQMTWGGALNNPYPGVNHPYHGGEWLYALAAEEQQRIAHRLMALPLVIEVATPAGIVGIVHADCPYDDWAFMQSEDWQQLSETHPMVDTCLWSIARYQRKYTGVIRNVRAVIHGHMTVPEMRTLGNVFYIDTGGWKKGGRYTFLNLHTLEPAYGP
ncbi:MAG: metallophosphoesterase [Methylophilaceae bacterium]